ncbi:WRKY transcription factor [Quillaja saponaria]|uniref:WRKY transcription factor n=1 Tax=Quillaja saponaria TaxID=32244 RepID=A0AAD7LEX4_QUISA|nr:WRKY transcription factor [Quillaja saponaria]
MSTTSQAMLNQQSLFEEHAPSDQMGFVPFPPNLTFPNSMGCYQSLKAFNTMINTSPNSLSSDAPSTTTNLTETLLASATTKPREDFTCNLGGAQLLSLQSSSANLWARGEQLSDCLSIKRSRGDDHHMHDHNRHLGVPHAMKMKKIKARRKVREPRFCFKTMSDVDVLDDGYKWRKYGQKVVKNTQHPRSYYRCTQDNCRVKKRVERLAEDPRMVITTYEGRHGHSPSNDVEDSQNHNSQLNNFFW